CPPEADHLRRARHHFIHRTEEKGKKRRAESEDSTQQAEDKLRCALHVYPSIFSSFGGRTQPPESLHFDGQFHLFGLHEIFAHHFPETQFDFLDRLRIDRFVARGPEDKHARSEERRVGKEGRCRCMKDDKTKTVKIYIM